MPSEVYPPIQITVRTIKFTRMVHVNIIGRASNDYYVNYKDAVTGFIVNGTLPVDEPQVFTL